MKVVQYGRVPLVAVILILASAIQGKSDVINVFPNDTGVAMLLPFPTNHPRILGLDTTTVTQASTTNFVFQYNLAPTNATGGTWHGAPNWDGVMLYWDPWAIDASWGYDLSGVTTFSFAVRSSAYIVRMTVEFESSDGEKSKAYLWDVDTNIQYYSMGTSFITNDITKMKGISFVVDYYLVGDAKTGTIEVAVNGLSRMFLRLRLRLWMCIRPQREMLRDCRTGRASARSTARKLFNIQRPTL